MLPRRTRRILFYGLIAIFVPIGALIAFYAQGWRFDFSTWEAQKVGGIYVKSSPLEVKIFLDDKETQNKSGFFQSGTLINDLFPEPHKLRLEYPGYKTWERTVDVKPAMVADVKYAILIPETSETIISGSKTKDFWLAGKKFVLSSGSKLALQDQTLPGNEVISISEDAKVFLTKDSTTNTYYITDEVTSTSTSVQVLARKTGFRLPRDASIVLDETSGNQLLIKGVSSLALFNFGTNQAVSLATSTSTSSPSTIGPLAVSRSWIAWSSYREKENVSEIYFSDKFFGVKKFISLAGKTTSLQWGGDRLGIIQDESQFYHYSPNQDAPKHLTGGVKKFKFNNDGGRVLVIGKDYLEVFSFKEESDHWRIPLQDAERITKIDWYKNDRNLFVGYPEKTALLELDDLGLENFKTVVPTDKTAYDAANDELYYLENGSLNSIDFSED